MLQVKIDDASFQRNLELYLRETSKSVIDAVNFKLYDGNREALKQTPKADKSSIKDALEAKSSKYPDRTLVEMLVIKQKQASGEDVFDLEAEVKKLTGKRTRAIGFVKAGYLPGIRKLLKYVGKAFATVTGVSKESFGGADPAKSTGSTVKGAFYNDVAGTGNKSFVEQIKEQGAEAGKNKINSDIVTYLARKLDIPIDKFNRS